ncbi:MAG: hypothetical protein JWO42_1496, partial [Chloroflexi bacterium]|nr:hypothetical protein [Chloroflexota bacterium]
AAQRVFSQSSPSRGVQPASVQITLPTNLAVVPAPYLRHLFHLCHLRFWTSHMPPMNAASEADPKEIHSPHFSVHSDHLDHPAATLPRSRSRPRAL